MMNIFEQASRQKLRFQSSKGELTSEQLWDLPLQSKTQFDLDTVAKTVSRDLKGVTEESFVSTAANPANARLTLALEVVKHVIAVKIAENEASRKRADREDERKKLLAALANKEESALNAMTADEIRQRLVELES